MTARVIGVPTEIKDNENRVAVQPDGVAELVHAGHQVVVQAGAGAGSRFTDVEFTAAGATLVDDATDCRFIVGVKEVKTSQVKPGQTVMCFSHTIKGQSHNMPLLAHFMKQGATLIDYEVIVDDAVARGEGEPTFVKVEEKRSA